MHEVKRSKFLHLQSKSRLRLLKGWRSSSARGTTASTMGPEARRAARSQLMAERCTGESENAPTRDASAASAVASAGGLLEQRSGGVLPDAAAAGRGDEGKDGGAEHSSAEGKAREGEEGSNSPPPLPPLSSRARPAEEDPSPLLLVRRPRRRAVPIPRRHGPGGEMERDGARDGARGGEI